MNQAYDDTRIRTVIARFSGCDASRLDPEHDLRETLDLDSLGRLELLSAVEDGLDVYFTDQQIAEIRTLAELRNAVEALLIEYA